MEEQEAEWRKKRATTSKPPSWKTHRIQGVRTGRCPSITLRWSACHHFNSPRQSCTIVWRRILSGGGTCSLPRRLSLSRRGRSCASRLWELILRLSFNDRLIRTEDAAGKSRTPLPLLTIFPMSAYNIRHHFPPSSISIVDNEIIAIASSQRLNDSLLKSTHS